MYERAIKTLVWRSRQGERIVYEIPAPIAEIDSRTHTPVLIPPAQPYQYVYRAKLRPATAHDLERLGGPGDKIV